MTDYDIDLSNSIAVVVPAYRVEKEIDGVIRSLPSNISHIIVVDDFSPDNTGVILTRLLSDEPRLVVIRHERNQGVGGAMISGFRKALDLGAHIVIKIDGDGQMDPKAIPSLVAPLMQGLADYTKGNRFRDFTSLRRMPLIRRVGNTALGFLTKAATGYWNIIDPTNGFFAIRADVLALIPLDRIARSYYFETSMLAQLYLVGAYVMDIPMPARYGVESSNLRLHRVLVEFPPRLIGTLLQRILLKHFLFDFSMVSIYLLSGIPLFLFGIIFGLIKWIKYASLGVPAPTGTVVLPMMCILLGIQFLLSAIQIDLQSVPRAPITTPMQSK